MKKKLIKIYLIFSLASALFADELSNYAPDWWDGKIPAETGVDANYETANIGQLMYMSKIAREEINSKYPSNSQYSQALNALVDGFIANNTANVSNLNFNLENNYAILNVGQLKYVAQIFYDRLWEIAEANPNSIIWPEGMDSFRGVGKYPWTSTPPIDAPNYESEIQKNYAIANIGQVKFLFSWSLSISEVLPVIPVIDSDEDGIDDRWEYFYFGNITTANASSNYTGGENTDKENYLSRNPEPTKNQNVFLEVNTCLER